MALGIEEALLGYALYKMWRGYKGGTGKAAAKAPWPKEGQTPLSKAADEKWQRMSPKQKKAAVKATKGEGGFGTDEEALLAAMKGSER